MSKAFDRIKNGLDDIAAWKAGATTATIHFDGQSYQMTRPEHDAFRLGVAAGRLAGLNEAAEVVKPIGKRPCDCEPWRCYCEKTEDAASVAAWDHSDGLYAAILALAKP